MNLTSTGQKHKVKGTETTNCEPVGSVQLPQKVVQDSGPGASPLPEHLKDLYDRNSYHWTEARPMSAGAQSPLQMLASLFCRAFTYLESSVVLVSYN